MRIPTRGLTGASPPAQDGPALSALVPRLRTIPAHTRRAQRRRAPVAGVSLPFLGPSPLAQGGPASSTHGMSLRTIPSAQVRCEEGTTPPRCAGRTRATTGPGACPWDHPRCAGRTRRSQDDDEDGTIPAAARGGPLPAPRVPYLSGGPSPPARGSGSQGVRTIPATRGGHTAAPCKTEGVGPSLLRGAEKLHRPTAKQ